MVMAILFDVIIILLSVFNVPSIALYTGDLCALQSTGESGQCTLFSDCPSEVEKLRKYQIFPQTCGFEGTKPIVCCPQNAISEPATTQKTTTTTTQKTTTTTESTTPKRTSTGPIGSISKDRCREYSKYVRSRFKPPILLLEVEEVEKDECGFRAVQLIVGGEKAQRKEFPHMVSVGYASPAGDEPLWYCGGSLISDRFVVTAAHCLESREYGPARYVQMGITNLRDNKNRQQYTIAERIKHPEYRPPSHYNDIALLRTETQIRLNGYVRPACLYTKPEIDTRKAIASGWGKTDFAGSSSNELLKVTLDLIDISTCNDSYKSIIGRKLRHGILGESQVCAGTLDKDKEKDTCQGDSGGPLQIYHTGDNIECMYDIVGVTSFGKACGIGSIPGVYTKLSHYIEWIEGHVWS